MKFRGEDRKGWERREAEGSGTDWKDKERKGVVIY